jgi:nucleotidyltransferase/DNA polymerase involved in DNA repair
LAARCSAASPASFLQQHFGKAGSYYYWVARGVDERPVRADRKRKSVGAENTFSTDLFTYEAARDALREIVDKVWRSGSTKAEDGPLIMPGKRQVADGRGIDIALRL